LHHPHSTAISLAYVGGWVFGLCGATDALAREARRLIALSEQHRLGAFHTFGLAFLGWSECQRGNLDVGVDVLRRAIDAFDAIGYRLSLAGNLANLADAQRQRGELVEAETLCKRALQLLADGSDRWLEPEVRRIEAEIACRLNRESREEIEQLYRNAVGRARALNFPVFEARCLRSLQRFLEGHCPDPDVENRIVALAAFDNLPTKVARVLREYADVTI
jgi:predicted ATPase